MKIHLTIFSLVALFLGILYSYGGHAIPVVVHATTVASDPEIIIAVNTTQDLSDVTNTSQCSLREAITAINTKTNFGGCTASDWSKSIYGISVPAGNYVLTILDTSPSDENENKTGDLDVKVSMVIKGVGAGQTIIDGNGKSRVFHLQNGADTTVTLKGMSIQNGLSTEDSGGVKLSGAGAVLLDSVAIKNNTAKTYGGALYNFVANLSISNSTISGNTAIQGSGAIHNGATLTISDTTIEGNKSQASVGAIGSYSAGSISIGNTKIINNTATGDVGGVILATSGKVVVNNSLIQGNAAGGQIGGVDVNSLNNTKGDTWFDNVQITNNSSGTHIGGLGNFSKLTLNNSTISGNTATDHSGGIYTGNGTELNLVSSAVDGNKAGNYGAGFSIEGKANVGIINSTISNNLTKKIAGINNWGGNLFIRNSTVSGNTASSDTGGGLQNGNGGVATLINATFANNSAAGAGGSIYNLSDGSVYVINSIFSSINENCSGNVNGIASYGGNISSDSSCGNIFNKTNDKNNTDPKLGSLKDNGGTAFTHALLVGSPAINNGIAVAEVTADERGAARTDGKIDTGAYEYGGSVAITTPTLSPTSGNETGCALKSKGDVNCDGVVNGADYDSWAVQYSKSQYNKAVDFDNNSTVDLREYEIWRYTALK
ncbi:CSLREA domain-containing protein [Candidatus Roizmanbacteria bacterium]|nr:CSLREA domain-containing protein [Candidatus Roizmanbacteria bacterium]